MSWEQGTASNYLDLLAKLHAFLLKGHALPPVFTGTGTGTITGVVGTASSSQETITITFTSATAFTVAGSVTGAMGSGTVGTLYTHAKVAFTVTAGGIAWAAGDTISFVTTPPWVAVKDMIGFAASSQYSDDHQPYHAFDGTAATSWMTIDGTTAGTLEAHFGAAHEVVEYMIMARNDANDPGSAPRAWTMECWDGSAWVVADTQTAQLTWGQGEQRTFVLSVPRTATKFRLNITQNNGQTYTGLATFGLRSSTGGTNVATIGVVWRAPGNANTDAIYLGAKPYFHAGADYYNWRLGAFTGYTDTSLWDGQPGGDISEHLYLWNASIPYWFIADGKHISVVANVSTVYESMRLGFIDQYASPGQFPYPVFVGGSACHSAEPARSSLSWRWSDTTDAHSAFWKPKNTWTPQLKMRRLDGTWAPFDTSNAAANGKESQGSAYYGAVWPYASGQAGMSFLMANLDGTFPLFPIIPFDIQGSYGELGDVMATTGYLQTAENTITVDRVPWLVVPNIFRSTRTDYAAFRLA